MESGTPAELTNVFNKSKAKTLKAIRAERAAAMAKAAAAPPTELNANLVAMFENPSSKITQAEPVAAAQAPVQQVFGNVGSVVLPSDPPSSFSVERLVSQTKKKKPSWMKIVNSVIKNNKPLNNSTRNNQENKLPITLANKESEMGELIKDRCIQLYDPCTGIPLEINTIDELQKRINLIKSNTLKEDPNNKVFPLEIKTRLDLLVELLKRPEPPNDSLFQYTNNPHLYEAYWDIVFALNLLDEYKRTPSFFMVSKKAEEIRSLDEPGYIANPLEYLDARAVNMGASGASDITFCYKQLTHYASADPCEAPPLSAEACGVGTSSDKTIEKPRFYFCSSKYYKRDDKKGVENFDIQKIYTAAKNLHIDYDVKIILLVKNSEAVDKKLKKAISKYIAEEASAVYGKEQLYAALRIFYDLTRSKLQENITKESLESMLSIEKVPKEILKPRLHQHMAILKIKNAVEKFRLSGGPSNKFLVGILPRGGKTYIAGGIVSTLQPKRVVVLLGAKSETISQFTNDLFKFYQDFSDYEVIDLLEESADMQIDPSKKYIFVMSVELYKTEASQRKILIDLKGGETPADLFICDEAHLKQTTQKAIQQLEEGTVTKSSDKEEEQQLEGLDSVIRSDVPVVYMTGTYIKPLSVFNIPSEHTILWEYQDIQEGKNIITSQEYFKDNFGHIYEEALAKAMSYGETLQSIQTMYRKFPNLYLLSTQFTDDVKKEFLEQEKGLGFPTITHLFQVKKDYNPFQISPDNWHTGFMNSKGIARLINYLSPRPEIISANGGENVSISSVMKRIDHIAQRIGDRLAFFTSEFVVHSQLWFLPMMQGHPLIKRMTALAGIIFQSPWYVKHFNVLAVSSSADWSKIQGAKHSRVKINGGTFTWACPRSGETLKDCILREELAARSKGRGLVILAQNMLHLGISLACVDIVVLLDAGEKVDERIQKMYRALTESTNKRGGFIIDMNYFRTVTAIMNYQIQATKSRKGVKDVYAEDTKEHFNTILNTYSIDDDLNIYSTNEEGGESRIEKETIPELQRILQRAPSKRGNGIAISQVGDMLNKNINSVLAQNYSNSLDDILGKISKNKDKKVLREGEQGVQQASELKENKDPSERQPRQDVLFPNQIASKPEEKRRAFLDIFKTTMKIGVFGTAYKTIPELIEGLRTNVELREILVDTLVKRDAVKEGINIDWLIDRIVIPELEKIEGLGRGSSYLKMKEHFNDKDTRDAKFQDVLKYIVDHLAPKDKERHKYGEVFTPLTLVDEMLSKLPEEVWHKKDYKWLDPANGIGNFPIKAFIGQIEGEFKYPGLFEGLRKSIPDDGKRCKWIIENMLYMIDINGKNNLVAKRLFEKICPGAKANIEQIDKKNGFLSEKPLVFNGKEVKEFDVVMGNPPYQGGAVKSVSTTSTRKIRKESGLTTDLNKNLWIPFVNTSLKYLKNDGFLVFIHPIGWFKPDGLKPQIELHNLMLSKQILSMRIYKDNQAGKLFGGYGAITVSYYVLQNKGVTKPTTVIDILENTEHVTLSPKSVIILAYNSILNKAMKKAPILNDTDDLKQKALSKKDCNDGGQYKNIQKISEDGNIVIIRSEKKMDNFDYPKLYIDGINYPRTYYDKDGEYGIIDQNQFYIIGDKLKKQDDYFKTKLSALLLKYIKYRMNFIEPRYYPDVRSLPIAKITDETLAEYFGFTKEERAAINATEYPKREYKLKEISCAEVKKEKEATEGGAKTHRYTRRKSRT